VFGIIFCPAVYGTNTPPIFNNGTSFSYPSSICQNSSAINITNYLSVSDVDNGQTETWTINVGPNHGGVLSGFSTSNTNSSGSTVILPGNNIFYTPANNYYGAENFVIQVSDGQASATITFNVTISQNPTITTQSLWPICSGLNTNISLTANINSTYSWSLGTITGNISGASAGTGNTIIQTLNNPSNVAQGSVIYNVVAVSQVGNCSSSTTPITVNVNPTPLMNTASPGNICSGTNTNISLSATTASNFSWTYTVNSGGITGASSGTSSSINQLLINPSNVNSGSVSYTVTPTSIAGSCVGQPSVLTETVYPSPQLLNSNSVSICSGSGANINFSASIQSTFSWTVVGTIGNISGASASSGSLLNQVLINSQNNAVGSVTYSIVPVSVNGLCQGSPSNITVTVNPQPVLSNSTLVSVCSGSSPNINLSASMPCTYTWSLGTNTGNITGASPGLGSIINQSLSNPTNNNAGSIIYNVLPVSTILGSCPGNTTSILVTVNPLPSLISVSADTICSTNSPNIILNATVASTFNWTIGNINGGILGGYGLSGNSINQVLTNPNHSHTGNIAYIVVPTSVNGNCIGTAKQIIITVYPQPLVSITPTISLCSGTALNLPITCSTPASFSWTPGANVGNITGATNAMGNTLKDTLVNPSHSSTGNITYFITPVADTGNCLGPTQALTVSVYPVPIVNDISDTICNNSNLLIPLHASCPSTYLWSYQFVSGSIGGATSGADSTINQTLLNFSDSSQSLIAYKIIPTSLNSCMGDTANLMVWVNPSPVLVSGETITLCSESVLNYTPASSLSNTMPTPSFTWQKINPNCYDSSMSVSPVTGSFVDSISSNYNNSIQRIQYVCSLSYKLGRTCINTDTLIIIINPKPAPASITTSPGAGVCPNTLYQNFGIKNVNGNEHYLWQSIIDTGNAVIYAQGYVNQNALVSFASTPESSYKAYVAIRAAYDTFSCYSYAIDTVSIMHNSPRDSGTIYLYDNFLVYQDNTVSSFLWGYDRKGTLDSGIFYGANYNQSYQINPVTDTADKYIWVITVKNGCLQKTYFNAPSANTIVPVRTFPSADFILYPNPANDNIYIKSLTQNLEHFQYAVNDISGHLIIEGAWEGTTKKAIRLEQLSPGSYFINIFSQGKRIKTLSFIKNQ
jgi:hypothetical protein